MLNSKKSNTKSIFVLAISLTIMIILVVILIVRKSPKTIISGGVERGTSTTQAREKDPFLVSPEIEQAYLTVSPYSRPGKALNQVNAIVIHYVGNPGTSAQSNRDYFEKLKDDKSTVASSHYIIGLEGEIIQCVPLTEISYCSNSRNKDTIAIECCHPDKEGKFNNKTYSSLVKLTAALCNTYGLSPETDVIRHYDITGKLCPIYFVNNEDEWYGFKLAVKTQMGK